MALATINDVSHIYFCVKNNIKTADIIKQSKLCRRTVYRIKNFFEQFGDAKVSDYFEVRDANKKRCGRKRIVQSDSEVQFCNEKLDAGYAPDIIVNKYQISYSRSTFYNRISEGFFDKTKLPFKGKRKPNGHKESRGVMKGTRNISLRKHDFPNFEEEFGHFEGDTIVGANHKSSIVTLVERSSKLIVARKCKSRSSYHTIQSIDEWLSLNPGIVKSIVFDCGKEFSQWKLLEEKHGVIIYFADPGRPSQRGLNENSNGLLRRDGLTKSMCFKTISQEFIDSITEKRNGIPRRSLDFKTPNEIFHLEVSKIANDL